MELESFLDGPEDFDRLIESHGAEEVIPNLARDYWDKPSDLVNTIKGARSIRVTRKSVSTVAIFFHALGVGGGERVTRDLALLWLHMGLNVVVITNTEIVDTDYALPEEVERIVIPTFIGNMRDDYGERCTGLREALTSHNVDLLVFSHWFSDVVAFDILSAKTLGIPFLFYIQTSFTQFFLDADLPSRFVDILLQYSLADCIVCLDEMDRVFWRRFNSNVLRTNNPITHPLAASPSPLPGHNIIWPARVHVDKYPLRVVPIMSALVKKVPDAAIWMVGPADPRLQKQITIEARACGVERNIVFCGEQSETQMPLWYKKADAFLLTSKREGWSLALAEALSAGLPCVMYSLPYLTLAHENPAVISIVQGNADAAADALASVLTDKKRARIMGEEGRAFIERLCEYDYEAFWLDCFTSVLLKESTQADGMIAPPADTDREDSTFFEEVMWRELLESYRAHLESIEAERCQFEECRNLLKSKNEIIRDLEKTLEDTRLELNHILHSKSFKIGLALTAIPRHILKPFRKKS